MTANPRSLALLLAIVSAAVLLSVGCSDDGDDSADGTGTPTPSATSAPVTLDPASPAASLAPLATPEATLRLGEADSLYSVTLARVVDLLPGIDALAVGDFNGDSVDDLLIGAPFADRAGEPAGTDAGEAYVIFGSPGLSGGLDLANGSPDLLVRGAIGGDTLGFDVAAGDLNADGIDDVIIGAAASHSLENIRTDMGETYVIFGRPDLGGVVDTLLAEQDFTLLPAEGFARLGSSFAVADFNGDGIDDLAAGAPWAGREPNTPPGGPRTTVGEVYIVFGEEGLSGQRTVIREQQDVLLAGARKDDRFGESLAAGDVNGDGRMDLIVGSVGFEAPGRGDAAGGVFVFHGSSDWPERLTIDDADLAVLGTEADQELGEAVQAADLDGDGKDEVIAAARGSDGPDGRTSAGRMYVLDADGTGEIDISESAAVVYGPDIGSRLPLSILVGDVDGDGTLDLTASMMWTTDTERGLESVVYVLMNVTATGTRDLRTDVAETLIIQPAAENDGTGTGLALGDLNGDGKPELIVSAAGARASREQADRPVVHVLSLE